MDKKYISKKEKMSFGFSAVAGYLVAGIAQSYLMFFMTDILIVSASFVMVLMIVARVWDAINDPIMGMVIDSTSTKSGKMRPYVLFGSFIIAITTIALFLPLSSLSTTTKMVYATITYLLFGMAYTLVDVPAMGLMSVATPNTSERSSLLSFYVTVGTIGGLLPIGLLPIFEMFVPVKWLYFALAVFVGLIAFVAYFMLYKNAKERCATKTEKIKFVDKFKIALKNRPMVLTLLMSILASPRYLMLPALIYIATYVYSFGSLSSGMVLIVLYLVIGVGMFAGILICPKIYTKIGFKKTCILSGLIGGIAMILAYIVGIFNLYVALPLLTLGGLALGAFNVLPYPMVGESLDYLEYKTCQRMEGVCFSLNSFVTKFNNAVGFIGLALGLIVFGFVEPVVSGQALTQSQETINGLFMMITLIPGIGFLLSLIPISFYDFNGEKRELIYKELEVRRANSEKS